jgi:hypothetical protein
VVRALLLPLLLLGACAAPRIGVDRQQGVDGSWGVGKDALTLLDVTGTTATLSFRDRMFVFEGVRRLRGYLGADEVALEGDGLRIHADEERIVVAGPAGEVARPLAALPAGGRYVHRDGDLKPG